MQSQYKQEVPVGFFQITDLSSAVSVAAAWDTYAAANAGFPRAGAAQWVLLIDVTGAPVRWRAGDEADEVTAAVGSRIPVDNQLVYTSDVSSLWMIEESATAEVNISIFKQPN